MGKTKNEEEVKAEFNPVERRQFLMSIKNHKRTKRKRAEKLAKETLRKVRAERRHQRKEEREEVVKTLVQKQSKLGIKALPLFAEEEKALVMAEVDPSNPSEVKVTEIDITQPQE